MTRLFPKGIARHRSRLIEPAGVVARGAWALGLMLLAVEPAFAQSPLGPLPCEQQLGCQQQRVLDLKDYREWLEGQVALAKALLNEMRQALTQKEADLAACRKPTP